MNDWWVSSRHTEHQNIKQACQKITFPSKGSILTLFSFIFFTISNILFRRTFFERKSKHITKTLIKRDNFERIYLFIYSFFIPPYDTQMHQKLYHKCETLKKHFSCSKKWLQMQFMPKIVFLWKQPPRETHICKNKLILNQYR